MDKTMAKTIDNNASPIISVAMTAIKLIKLVIIIQFYGRSTGC